jgi:acetyl esterase/lipase
MTVKRLFIVIILLVMARAAAPAAGNPLVLDVWPGKAPGEKGDIGEEQLAVSPKEAEPVKRLTNVTRPTITVYQPEKAQNTNTAVLICRGGGYSILAMDLEGEEVAAWLNSIGVTGIVLKYRVPARKGQPMHLAPLQDAQRAVSLVRAHAQEWNLDPHHIGILGFSAGGHLAALSATNYDKRQYDALDDTDKVSCRPDCAMMIYPGGVVKPGTTRQWILHQSSAGPPSSPAIFTILGSKQATFSTRSCWLAMTSSMSL